MFDRRAVHIGAVAELLSEDKRAACLGLIGEAVTGVFRDRSGERERVAQAVVAERNGVLGRVDLGQGVVTRGRREGERSRDDFVWCESGLSFEGIRDRECLLPCEL